MMGDAGRRCYPDGMSAKKFYCLPSISVVDIVGADSIAIVHNLTTNDVKKLSLGESCESFVTEVRGKIVGHVMVVAIENGLRLVGPFGQSEAIAAHADRYTIREDATPTIRDDEFSAIVIPPDGADAAFSAASDSAHRVVVPWAGADSALLLVSQAKLADETERLAASGWEQNDESAFHALRVVSGFPWYGTDLTDKNLPQEADRDADAISFTKGCYLGQETVARLDALGQVQKKLVLWAIEGALPNVGTELEFDGKTVARLTSVSTTSETSAIAIAMTRRSHFDPGKSAKLDSGHVATTIPLPSSHNGVGDPN